MFRVEDSESRKRNLLKQQGRGLALRQLSVILVPQGQRLAQGWTGAGGQGIEKGQKIAFPKQKKVFFNLVHHHGQIYQIELPFPFKGSNTRTISKIAPHAKLGRYASQIRAPSKGVKPLKILGGRNSGIIYNVSNVAIRQNNLLLFS